MVDKVVKKFDDVLSHVDTVVQYMSVTNRWTAWNAVPLRSVRGESVIDV